MAEGETNKYVDPNGTTHLFEERRDSSNPTRKFYGRTLELGAAQTDSVWQIYAEDTVGTFFHRQWASGTRAFDKQWNLRATYFGAISFLNQYSLQLSGAANAWGSVTHTTDLTFANNAAFSILLWLKVTSTAAQTLIQKAATTGGNNGYTLELDGSQRIVFTHRGNTGLNQLSVRTTSSAGVQNGQWHLVGITKATGLAASTAKIYVDGVSQTLITITDTLTETTTNTSNLSCGSNISGGARFGPGNLDELGIWNVELTQAEITEIYNSNGGVIDLDLGSGQISGYVSWWRFGDGTFTTFPNIPDEGSAHTMVLQSAVVSGDLETEVPP